MIVRQLTAVVALLAVALALSGVSSKAQAPTVVHGADSSFSNATVKLAWAVHKSGTEEAVEVIIRVRNIAAAYRWIRLDGVDPFTKARTVFVAAHALGDQVDLTVLRKAFIDHPSAEIQLFVSEQDAIADRPALTIFYLGVPDTTPEFLRLADVERYLAQALRR